ncbi:beta-ketoacyl synthase-like protein [Mesocricetibacter intestinalis]|uniref:Beta-ketoacyl synthase-like protein n=1 Tax=Mesocricetibacter intestinalis TaxID=1521930 RepID=A0A4R6V7V5_9PAST|nr:beta-ketoacyl synthase chain length factor [Mesocricetibacter intestinalis]TDQ57686.1 beta-ketoacyl synthase-like protein [Mesocricetibacter intestinalis]
MRAQGAADSKICDLSFRVAAWNMVCDKLISPEDWKAGPAHWIRAAEQWQDFSPCLDFLAPLKRRRLSQPARLFFAAAWPLSEQLQNIPVVYASLNGEINRNFALWLSLLREGDISPTSFSLSVHNALIGQWSELRGVRQEMTALTARRDSFESAITEACLLLNEGHRRVLTVIAESPLSPLYNVKGAERQPFSYALAMLIEGGEEYRLALHCGDYRDGETDNALNWVRNQYLQEKTWKTPGSAGNHWQWYKS